MNTQNQNTASNETPQQKKIKAMAIRYNRYIAKNNDQININKKTQCLNNWIGLFHSSFSSFWKCIMPLALRGPSTPYQSLVQSLTQQQKQQIRNLSISKKSISESIRCGHSTVLITLHPEQVSNTLSKLNNNQQFNLLTRNKVEVIPIYLKKSFYQKDILFKIKEFLENRNLSQDAYIKQYVLVCWKGLFTEILIIDFFSLDDSNLCNKVLTALQKRANYESEVKEVAGYVGSMANQLQKSITGLKKSDPQ